MASQESKRLRFESFWRVLARWEKKRVQSIFWAIEVRQTNTCSINEESNIACATALCSSYDMFCCKIRKLHEELMYWNLIFMKRKSPPRVLPFRWHWFEVPCPDFGLDIFPCRFRVNQCCFLKGNKPSGMVEDDSFEVLRSVDRGSWQIIIVTCW